MGGIDWPGIPGPLSSLGEVLSVGANRLLVNVNFVEFFLLENAIENAGDSS